LPLENSFPWQRAIREFIDSVPALTELVGHDATGLLIREEVTEQEGLVIQAWVRKHYRRFVSGGALV
jgi:hypothetical protein